MIVDALTVVVISRQFPPVWSTINSANATLAQLTLRGSDTVALGDEEDSKALTAARDSVPEHEKQVSLQCDVRCSQ